MQRTAAMHQPPGSASAVAAESPRAGSGASSCSVSHTRSAAASPGWLHCTRCALAQRHACSADVSRAHTARRRSDTAPRVVSLQSCAAFGPRFGFVQRSFDSSVALQHFHCSLRRARPNHKHRQRGERKAWIALQQTACIATEQPGPRRWNVRLGCIAHIPAALQRRNAPETWLTPCVALADLTEALLQYKVIFCNIHTSWLQGLVSVARGPAALGWPQAACLIHGGRGIFMKPRLADGVHE